MADADELEEGTYATLLHFAVKENDVKKVRELLQEGAKVTTRDIVGRTPLHWALVFGHGEAARALIVNTPRRALDARDERGCTPLHYAAARAHADVARILVERGAGVNAFDAKRRTPLHYAAQHASPEMVELLVSRGADKSLADVKGELPVDIAEKWGSLSSVSCLRPAASKPATDEVQVSEVVENKDKEVGVPTSTGPVVEKPMRKGPSLERLLGAWKAAEMESRRKKEAVLEAAHKATATLQAALRAWRESEQAARMERLGACTSASSNACESQLVRGDDATWDGASTSESGSASSPRCLSVEIPCFSSNIGEDSSTDKPRRDLSWCTEWEAQEGATESSPPVLSPRERRSPSVVAPKEDAPVWVQVPMLRQQFDRNFDHVSLKRSNSFDRAHFLVEIGGMATKLPFMSSLEVY